MKQILCLSRQPWSSSPGRTQQLVSRLRDVQILYFSPAARRFDRSFLQRGRKVRPNVTAYTLPPLLPVGEQHTALFRAGQRKLGRFIADRAERHHFSAPLLWTSGPEHVHLLDYLKYGGLVYDCDRFWEGLPPAWEGSLAAAADLVFAASPQLVARLSPCSSNIALLPNGVNYPLFSGSSPSRPDPLAQLHGPVLGWAGTLRAELDLSPLAFAAQARPHWTFLLLGREEGNPLLPQLRLLPNVILPGPCPLDQVPDWLSRCHVLLDFLRADRAEDGVISPRMYEYFSTGKPVVSMLWPDQVEPFPDVVYGAHDSREFVVLCEHAMEEASGFVSQRRRDRAAAAAWSVRAGEVARILTTAGLL